MAKIAIYNGEAERLFVQEGLGLDSIVEILGRKLSRKTLYNWKKDGKWDEKRKLYVAQTKEMRDEIRELAKITLKNAKTNPTPKNMLAFVRAIAALKTYEGVKLFEEETTPTERKELTGDMISKIEQDLKIL